MTELFRFSATRPAQRTDAQPVPPLVSTTDAATEWFDASPADALSAASDHIASSSFPRSLQQAWPVLAKLDAWLIAHSDTPTPDELIDVLEQISGTPIKTLAADNALLDARARLSDALAAVHIAGQSPGPVAHLTRGLRLVALIQRLASHDVDPLRAPRLRRLLSAAPVVPKSRPSAKAVTTRTASPEETAKEQTRLRQTVAELDRDLRAIERAARTTPASFVITDAARGARFVTSRPLSPSMLAQFSDSTRAAVSGASDPPLTLMDLRGLLQGEILRLWPGIVLGIPVTPAVPQTVGIARISGIADLLAVEQTHTRYTLGEVSHIENILPGETFSRMFRRATSIEDFEQLEQETVEQNERELQSTTRSELRNEVRRSLEERLEFEAGASVNYTGPNVSVGVEASFSYARATQEAHDTASKFARDVVDRAATNVTETTRSLRSTRRRTDTEDVATRELSNEGSSPTVGVYRWVDRVLGFELLNYDRRLLVECVVPEPSAFLRFSKSRRAPAGVAVPRPLPMRADAAGLPVDEGGQPLQPGDLNANNIGAWIARYGVSGVRQPPPATTMVSAVLAIDEPGAPGSAGDSVSKVLETGALSVPDGYVATDLNVAVASEFDAPGYFYDIKIGTAMIKQLANGTRVFEDLQPASLVGNVPVSIVAKNFENVTVNIVIECIRTDAHYAAWQVETYEAVAAEYQRQLSEHRDAIAGATLQQGLAGDFGTHPATLRELERNELKRGAITALSGQSFGLFDALREQASGAPTELALSEATAEGSYIQFVEQAFEWRAMSYVLYPYYWSRKEHWEDHAFMDHVDALFARFLRAGSARVVIPVRPGFEPAVRYFFDRGKPWLGGDPPSVADGDEADPEAPPYIHVAEELAEQLGRDFTPADGVASVRSGERDVDLSRVDFEFGYAWTGRKVRLAGVEYRVVSADGSLGTLDRAYEGESADVDLEVGPRVVGRPWETVLPTTLVMLDGTGPELPRVEAQRS